MEESLPLKAPGAPNARTTRGKAGVLHLTHAAAVKVALFGMEEGALAAVKRVLPASASAPEAEPVRSATKLGAAPESVKADTPSALEPER